MNITKKTWNNLNMDNSIVLVGIAPIEEHGKHMPLGVDYFFTNRWMNDVANLLEENKLNNVYSLPIIPMGNADIKGFKGNIHVSQKLIYQTIYEILMSICNWGVKNIIVISAHADPKHLIAIEQACEHINKKKGILAFAPMGAIFSGSELNITVNKNKNVLKMLEKYPNDFHAGWIETSLMLYYNNEMVNERYKSTKDVLITQREMIYPNIIRKRTKDEGHLGYPQHASAILGKHLHEDMVNAIYKATLLFVRREGYEKYMHHFLYKIPFLRAKKMRR